MSQEQQQLLQAARGQASKYAWPAALLARVEQAINDADPWGPDSLASGPRWFAAITDELLDLQEQLDPTDQARLAKLLSVASVGASGAERYNVADMAADYAGGVAGTVGNIAAEAAGVPDKLGDAARSPGGVALLLLVLAGGALWLRGR